MPNSQISFRLPAGQPAGRVWNRRTLNIRHIDLLFFCLLVIRHHLLPELRIALVRGNVMYNGPKGARQLCDALSLLTSAACCPHRRR